MKGFLFWYESLENHINAETLICTAFQHSIKSKHQTGISFGIVMLMNPYQPRLKDFIMVIAVAILLTAVAYIIHKLHTS